MITINDLYMTKDEFENLLWAYLKQERNSVNFVGKARENLYKIKQMLVDIDNLLGEGLIGEY